MISRIIILFELTSGVLGLFNFRVIQNRVLPTSSISLRFPNVDTICKCRNLCFAHIQCEAVSVYDNGDGTYDCHLAAKFPTMYYDLKPMSTVITLVNKVMPRCIDPFKMTQFGCIYMISFNANYSASRNSCGSLDADLLTLDSDEQTPAFWSEIRTLYSEIGYWWRVWVGVVNGTWLNGVPVAGLSSSSSSCGLITAGAVQDNHCSSAYYSLCRRVLFE
ncbi:uncharacterized protein [Palaemon carinicauda]|uniref:uncharacterized protein n=1 Tax=Palaemon carinicauda TaxID=392227 RepID=UPI0035B57143